MFNEKVKIRGIQATKAVMGTIGQICFSHPGAKNTLKLTFCFSLPLLVKLILQKKLPTTCLVVVGWGWVQPGKTVVWVESADYIFRRFGSVFNLALQQLQFLYLVLPSCVIRRIAEWAKKEYTHTCMHTYKLQVQYNYIVLIYKIFFQMSCYIEQESHGYL